MKVSELIFTLQRLGMEEGDVEVFIDGERLFTVEMSRDMESGHNIVWIQQVEE